MKKFVIRYWLMQLRKLRRRQAGGAVQRPENQTASHVDVIPGLKCKDQD